MVTSIQPKSEVVKAELSVFVHVPKTAGSTVNKILKDEMEGEMHVEKYASLDPASFQQKIQNYKWISGHVTFPKFQELLKDSELKTRYFSMVREPVAQVASHLNWLIEIFYKGGEFYDNHPEGIKNISTDIRENGLKTPDDVILMLSKYQLLFLNNQTFYVTGRRIPPAKNSLDDYEFVALESQIDQLLKKMLTQDQLEIVPSENVSGYHFDKDLFNSDTVKNFLAEKNASDQILYSLVKRKFRGRSFFSRIFGGAVLPHSLLKKDVPAAANSASASPAVDNLVQPIKALPKVTLVKNATLLPKTRTQGFDFTGGVYDAKGRFVEASQRPSNIARAKHVPQDNIRLPSGLSKVEGRGLYLGYVFEMYGHDLLETTGRMWTLLENEAPYDWLCAALWHKDSNPAKALQSEPFASITRLLFPNLPIYIVSEEPVEFAQLEVPAPAYRINEYSNEVYRQLIVRLTERALAEIPADCDFKENIYLSRGAWSLNKRFDNEQAIESAAKDAGFDVVYPEQHSFTMQIGMMQNAKYVAGLDGSALHSYMFTSHGAKMLSFDTRDERNQKIIDQLFELDNTHVSLYAFKNKPENEVYDLARAQFLKLMQSN